MLGYAWPGNVRELQNFIRRFLSVGRWDFQETSQTVRSSTDETGRPLVHAVRDLERTAILKALDETRWNRSRAAERLGISRRALYRKMRRYGLK
jgi:transcriptional regulator of acetoin/glycerol metabolism